MFDNIPGEMPALLTRRIRALHLVPRSKPSPTGNTTARDYSHASTENNASQPSAQGYGSDIESGPVVSQAIRMRPRAGMKSIQADSRLRRCSYILARKTNLRHAGHGLRFVRWEARDSSVPPDTISTASFAGTDNFANRGSARGLRRPWIVYCAKPKAEPLWPSPGPRLPGRRRSR